MGIKLINYLRKSQKSIKVSSGLRNNNNSVSLDSAFEICQLDVFCG